MTVSEFVARYQPQRRGNGWVMKCPTHDDSTASLSIGEGKNGIILLHCFAGCEVNAIVARLGITEKDLFPNEMFTATNLQPQRKRAKKQQPRPFDWQKCVAAFTEKDGEKIAKWRGYSLEFVRELHAKGLIGVHTHYGARFVAFPVHKDGQTVACHFRLKGGRSWQYFPNGCTAEPWVIGELQPDRNNVFESTWDGLSYADKSGEREGIIITRGVVNAKRAAVLIPEGSTAFLWTQNDTPNPKTGVKPAEKWQQDFVEASSCRILRPTIPAHDLNDWTKNGATPNDLMAALASAEAIREQPLEFQAEAAPSTRETLATPVTLDDFRAYMPMHNYIFVPSRDMWPASSVNARIQPVPLIRNGKPVLSEDGKQKFINASAWLDQNSPVEMMTWAPALPMVIKNRLISEGGWIEHAGCSTFNLYRPPTIKLGDAKKAGPWLDHVTMVYPNDREHIIRWLASRVQRPHVKINHALVLIGPQGIGKDTVIHPVKHAVGMWNVKDILPPTLLGRFNDFVKSILLIINEVHDLGEFNRYSFYERLKAVTAAPPETIRVDEKYLREYQVLNVCGVILTSNFKLGGLYLPADDRRHYVASSDLDKKDIPEQYWKHIYAWYDAGGIRHVAAYLTKLDISKFDPKAPPPKTNAFWEIADSNVAPENAELADALDMLNNPLAVTIENVTNVLSDTNEFHWWLKDRKNSRSIPHRFEEIGYVAVRNPDSPADGRWKIGEQRCVIYVKKTLCLRDQIRAARALVQGKMITQADLDEVRERP
jgi:hypothetical protein